MISFTGNSKKTNLVYGERMQLVAQGLEWEGMRKIWGVIEMVCILIVSEYTCQNSSNCTCKMDTS